MRVSKNVRYLILLLILLAIALNEAVVKSRSVAWEKPLRVQVFAISGDRRPASQDYVAELGARDFEAIERFVNREARRYGLVDDAIEVEYAGRLESHPPALPAGSSILGNVWWSLRFRAWAWWRGFRADGSSGDIELYVSYFDTAATQSLRHSVGLRGGLIGLIHAFAHVSYRGSNNVVITHELMHTLGALDKYGAGNQPLYPAGFAEPWRQPLYPQAKAEIMGGRIPLSTRHLRMPVSLAEVVVGPYTAAEINWPIPDS